jgi:hypothetical protein
MSSPGPNPYAPPGAPTAPGASILADSSACPRCHNTDLYMPTVTWWGGILGPRLFNHTVCRRCEFGFNGKTRKSNAPAIGICLVANVLLILAIIEIQDC